MNKQLNLLAIALLISHTSSGIAASSVDLTVKGLITPSACEPSLSNDGVYDIGKISAKDLISTNAPDPVNESLLGSYRLQLTVTCDAATLMAVEPSDNRG